MDKQAMRSIGKAIKTLDEIWVTETSVGSEKNVVRINNARKNLINTLFSNGYELQRDTYRVIKSKVKRELIPG